MTSERQVKMAARMYEARETVRFFWGADYQKSIREVIEKIKVIQQQRGDEDLLSTCIFAAKQAAEAGETFYSMAVIAAYVEDTEPTPQEASS